MKMTKIDRIPIELPAEILRLADGAAVYDSSSSPEARVYFIERDNGYFLKIGEPGALGREAELIERFNKLSLTSRVLYYSTGERDIMLTERVAGKDLTDYTYLSDPKRLAAALGENMRVLHDIDTSSLDMPVRLGEYLGRAEDNYRTGNYDSSHFPDSFGYRSADEAHGVLLMGADNLVADTLIHGDYCLPNILFNDWKLSGYIDLGMAGISDRHIDLFWGAWTLGFNLHTDEYRNIFFDAYGRDMIDEDKLLTVAAAEVFG